MAKLILVLVVGICLCIMGYNEYEVHKQIASVEQSIKEGGTTSNIEEYLKWQFEADGNLYVCVEKDAEFYEDTKFEKKIENPVFIGTKCCNVYKKNIMYYCYLLADGRIAFSNEDYYWSFDLREIKK